MFHLKSKPRPPSATGAVILGQALASSAAVSAPRHFAVNGFVERAQEGGRLEVFVVAAFVRDPLAVVASVVEVQERRNGIDAQSIDVIFANQKRALAIRKFATSRRPRL